MAGEVTSVAITPETAAAPSGAPENTGAPQEGSELILGKFKTQDDLAAAYAELEKKFTQKQQEPTTPPAAEAPTTAEVAKAEQKGIDFDALSAEYATAGVLAEQTYATLEAAGFPKARVDAYIAGQNALREQMESRVAGAIGGSEAMQQVLTWAASNLSDAEASAYDAALATGNEALITQAVQGLAAKYEGVMGRTPQLLNGSTVPSSTGAKPFGDDNDMVRAMSDPKYLEGDKAYHQEIEARLRATYGF